MRHESFDLAGFQTRDPVRHRLAKYGRTKRVLDILGVAALAPLAVPLVAGLWLVIRRDGGAGFFGHQRVGRDGVEFTCWKLRTMVPDAEAVLNAHLRADRAAAREWAHDYKLRADPRITRFGRFLRRSSLDELPQLWNILLGDMSLVGPRPVPRAELVEYEGNLRAYLALRPGLTGLWQVSGRNNVSYRDRVEMDVDYAFRAGLALDVLILCRTVGAVLRKTGV